jgi:hypothetical protein
MFVIRSLLIYLPDSRHWLPGLLSPKEVLHETDKGWFVSRGNALDGCTG